MLSAISVVGMPSLHQLPGGEPRALQVGPRLVGEDARELARRAPRSGSTPSAVP